ncbi:MAG TPA: hypothetical protein VGN80_01370 [Devosiaceae bacterium]|jgi:ElaB/YqjD/DUF883 family membrane-anchored ribosome-binding protein|nr:hypothetical protein [Devosiaceae bacterium]
MNTDNPMNPTPDKSSGTSGTAPDSERLRKDASAAAETAKRDLERVREEAESSVREIADQAQAQLEQAGEKFKGAAADQKDMLAEELASVAKAVSRVAEELRNEKAATASYASSIAGGMQRLSKDMRDKDVDELIGMAQDFGRRQPAAFMGTAALVGFAASRFLLASSRRRSESRSGMATGVGGYGSASSTYPDAGRPATARDGMKGTIK